MQATAILDKYFSSLTETQRAQFEALGPLYQEWNDKINVISRKDIENVYPHHILHSMAIAKLISFAPHARVLDLGTGGGLPGIPLAILFPKTEFWLVDSIRKKVTVTEAIAQSLKLKNVHTLQSRAEDLDKKFDFVITRGVAKLEKLMRWTEKLYRPKEQHALPNGLIALKGFPSVENEIKALNPDDYVEVYRLTDFYEEDFFETKCMVYVQA